MPLALSSMLVSLALLAGTVGQGLLPSGRGALDAPVRLAQTDARASGAGKAGGPDATPAAIHLVLVVEGGDVALDGIGVRAGAASAMTGREGGAELEVSPGSYRLVLEVPAGRLFAGPEGDARAGARTIELPEVEVVPGETSELIVTLSRTGELVQVLDEVAGKSHLDAAAAEAQSAAAQGPPGKLSGQVVSLEDGKPISGARVFVRGTTFEIETDKEGRFALELPSGTHALSVIHTRFSTRTLDGVEVPAGGEATLLVELSPAAVELDELVVTAPHVEGTVASVVDERRETAEVAEILGAEQMSKAGDSTAASALTRVTGVTLVGGRFVYVRGLGERYSSTLLNGADLPSPDPSRRVIPLDLFPTGVLGSVVVQKTYSPDMPGDFSGGVVQLRTRGVPEEFKFSLGVSTGGNSIATFRDGHTYRGGKHDWLGVDDGSRDIPKFIWDITERGTRRHDQLQLPFDQRATTAQKINAFDHNYVAREIAIPPNLGVDLAVGDRLVLPRDVKLGYQLASQYDQDWRFRPERRLQIVNDVAAGGLRADYPRDIRQTNQEFNLASIGTLAAQVGKNHLVEANALLTRKTTKITSVDLAITNEPAERREYTLRWNEQMLFAQQLRGEHTLERLGGLQLTWRVSRASSGRDEPDTREYMYSREPTVPGMPPDQFRYFTQGAPLQRSYETLADGSWVYGGDAKLPIELARETTLTLSAGGMHSRIDREARIYRFGFAVTRQIPDEFRLGTPDAIFSNQMLVGATPSPFRFQDKATLSDSYDAFLRVTGGYAMAEVARKEWLRVGAGARLEHAVISATTRPAYVDSQGNRPSVTGAIRRTDLLPAATATITTTEDTQLRLAVSNTVNRPQLRELSDAVFIDPDTRIPYRGDSKLKPADIYNYDARFEWYPSKTETVSLGGFVKTFRNPIEIKQFPTGESGILADRLLFNIDGAVNYGLEFDLRHELGRWDEDWLDGAYVSGNLALIHSEVEISPEQAGGLTNTRRPLQGQSPWIVNLQAGYVEPERGRWDAMVSFNMYGPRLVEVGEKPLPDVYEMPVPVLDVTASWMITSKLKLKLRGRNLIDPEYRVKQGAWNQRAYARGRGVSLALTYDF